MEKFAGMLFPHIAAGLAIDRPDGYSGHGAGAMAHFSEQFGVCLLHFATDAKPPSAC